MTCGGFTEAGEFVPLPAFDAAALLHAWDETVYALCLREEKIEPAVVEQIRGWQHSGFSVDQSVYLRAGDQAGIEPRGSTRAHITPRDRSHTHRGWVHAAAGHFDVCAVALAKAQAILHPLEFRLPLATLPSWRSHFS